MDVPIGDPVRITNRPRVKIVNHSGWLFVLFIWLKLAGYLDISWWWILIALIV